MPINQKPSHCKQCPLGNVRGGFIQYEGTCANKVLIVGEASGENEKLDSLPFRPYAQAGSMLQRAINDLGLKRSDFGITNILMCQPPGNVLDGASYELEAIAKCHTFLAQAIDYFKPKCILALGNVPLRALTGLHGKKRTVHWVRGYVFRSIHFNLPVVASYHPSYIARGKKNLLGIMGRDMLKAVKIAQGEYQEGIDFHTDPMRTYKNNYNLYASERDVEDSYKYLLKNPQIQIAYDIETPDSSEEEDEELDAKVKEIKQFQVSWEKGQALVFSRKQYDEKLFKQMIQLLLSLPQPKLGQNLWGFDDDIIKANGIKINGETIDILTMYRHWQPDTPAHLQYIGSVFNWGFAWKHYSGENLEWYGAVDTDIVLNVYDSLKQVMISEGVW